MYNLYLGAHFVTTRRTYRHIDNKDIPVNILGDYRLFYDTFPEVIINKFPIINKVLYNNISNICTCPAYCWTNSIAPWAFNNDWIRYYIRKAIFKYMNSVLKHAQKALHKLINDDHSHNNGTNNSKNNENKLNIKDSLRHFNLNYSHVLYHVSHQENNFKLVTKLNNDTNDFGSVKIEAELPFLPNVLIQ